MASLEGLKTWLDYEILLTKVVLAWGGKRLVEYLERLAPTTAEFTLYVAGFCLVGVLLAI